MYYRGTIVEGPRTHVPKRRKPPLIVLNSINGRGTTPEDDLVPICLKGPKCGKNSLSLSFTTECSAIKKPQERLLQYHHEAVDARHPPHRLGQGQAKNRCEQSSIAPAHNRHSTGESGTMRCRRDLVIRRRRKRSQANSLIFKGRRCFHTQQLRCKRSGSSKSSWSRRSRYAARVE